MLYRLQARADCCRPELLLLIGIRMVPASRGRARRALCLSAVAGGPCCGVSIYQLKSDEAFDEFRCAGCRALSSAREYEPVLAASEI